MRQTRHNDRQHKHSHSGCAFLMHWWAHRRTLRKVGKSSFFFSAALFVWKNA
nr:MAG TPA: hypothetical protein [Caudoviricetes sp.]